MFVDRPAGQLIELRPLFGRLVFMHANYVYIYVYVTLDATLIGK
jgi:hypothetical protein